VLLLEHEGKSVLQEYGIPTPQGVLVQDPADLAAALARVAMPLMVKAQALTGGRGRAGGIVPASDRGAAEKAALRLLGCEIRGAAVVGVLLEPRAAIRHEYYLALTLDGEQLLLLIGGHGGVAVEDYFSADPSGLVALPADPLLGVSEFQVRNGLERLGVPTRLWPEFAAIAVALSRLFRACDATLAEINPLAELEDGHLVALDARIAIDDGALFRQPRFAGLKRSPTRESGVIEKMRALDIQYVPLGGAVGLVSSGAGAGVTIMDWLDREGARLAAFVDLDYAIIGGHTVAAIELVLEHFLAAAEVRSIVVNFTTCGLRTDEIAGHLVAVLDRHKPLAKPVVIHIQGNRASLAHALLVKAGDPVEETLGGAVRAAARAALEEPRT
jgi:succinyl-CoA synthetase beta subunit